MGPPRCATGQGKVCNAGSVGQRPQLCSTTTYINGIACTQLRVPHERRKRQLIRTRRPLKSCRLRQSSRPTSPRVRPCHSLCGSSGQQSIVRLHVCLQSQQSGSSEAAVPVMLHRVGQQSGSSGQQSLSHCMPGSSGAAVDGRPDPAALKLRCTHAGTLRRCGRRRRIQARSQRPPSASWAPPRPRCTTVCLCGSSWAAVYRQIACLAAVRRQ